MFATIRVPPADGDFIPLAEYQSATPSTFFGGKPVLHCRLIAARAWLPAVDDGSLPLSLPIFPADAGDTAPTGLDGAALNGSGPEVREQKVDVFVSSENLTIFNNKAEAGIQIPYPAISIHAIKDVELGEQKAKAVWMQIEHPGSSDDEAPYDPIELTIIPSPGAESTSEEAAVPSSGGSSSSSPAAQQLFDSIAACSDLHPDPADEDDDEGDEAPWSDDRLLFEGDADGDSFPDLPGVRGLSSASFGGAGTDGLPPPMPGSSGWITADNVHEFFDTDGNWLGRGGPSASAGEEESLGEGAGRVRARDELDDDAGHANGHGHEPSLDSDAKRPRVD